MFLLKKILLPLFLFFSAQLFAQNPVASFTFQQIDNYTTCGNFTSTSTGNIVNYEWLVMDQTNSTFTTQNFYYCFADTGCFSVWLVVQDVMGNSDTSVQTICVHEKSIFFLPNAFTPNGDGLNDVYFAYGIQIPENGFEMRIYDYWGGLVFSSFDINRGWDGKKDGKNNTCPAGPYLVEIIWFDNTYQKHTERTSIFLSQ